MTNQNKDYSWLDEAIQKSLKRYEAYLNGSVPADLLYGRPDKEPFDIIVEEAVTSIQSHIDEHYIGKGEAKKCTCIMCEHHTSAHKLGWSKDD